jgi:hypothetical protein
MKSRLPGNDGEAVAGALDEQLESTAREKMRQIQGSTATYRRSIGFN